MTNVFIDSHLILVDLEVSSQTQGLIALSQQLETLHLVEPSFQAQIFGHEAVSATGLATSPSVAVYHITGQHINRSALALATLNRPLDFYELGDPDALLQVEIVLLLALTDPPAHLRWLERLAQMLYQPEFLLTLRWCVSPLTLAAYLRSVLNVLETPNPPRASGWGESFQSALSQPARAEGFYPSLPGY